MKFQTTTATIGIRNTVFDISCGNADAGDNPPPADVTDIACDQSLFACSRKGCIALASNDGSVVVLAAGRNGMLPVVQGSARPLQSTPLVLDRDPSLSNSAFNFRNCRR